MTDTIQISRELANQLIDDLISLIDYEWLEYQGRPDKQKAITDDIQSRKTALEKALEQVTDGNDNVIPELIKVSGDSNEIISYISDAEVARFQKTFLNPLLEKLLKGRLHSDHASE